MKKYVAENLLATRKFARQIALNFKGGEVIGLIGELGAGKTTLVQFLAQALGIKETVNSPTFVLLKIYQIPKSKKQKIPKYQRSNIKYLIHVDAYRLNNAEELKNIGLSEYLGRPDTVVVIEWADKVKEILPEKAMMIVIKEGQQEGQRIFNIK